MLRRLHTVAFRPRDSRAKAELPRQSEEAGARDRRGGREEQAGHRGPSGLSVTVMMHTSHLYKPTAGTTPRVNPTVNCGLQMMMMCPLSPTCHSSGG